MEKIVVTRHKALLEYLVKYGYVEKDVQHLTRARPEDIKGKHVYGILPNWLACHAGKLTELQLDLPIGKRHIELSIDDIEFHLNKKPRTYTIREVKDGV